MTLDSLRCFCAIVETGSFHAAADRVNRSQPAISQQLKSLERETGHTLIERKTARFTPAGQTLYARARQLLLNAETMAREMKDFDESASHELRVGTSDTTALYLLPPYVRRFAKLLPRTRLVLTNRSSDAIADLVARAELDLGIVTLPLLRSGLTEEVLFRQRMVLVLPARHPRAKAPRLTLHDLKNEPFLLIDEHTRTGALLRGCFRAAGFTPQTVMDSGSFEVIKRYVAEGVGLSFLPECVITPQDRRLRTRPLVELPEVSIGAIGRKGAYQSKAEQALLALLRTC